MGNDFMSNELNERLRAALRPIDPGEGFTQKVLAQVASQPAPMSARAQTRLAWFAHAPEGRWLSAAAMVTFLAVGIVIAHGWQVRRAQGGLEARRQVIEALRVTSDNLDVAYRVVRSAEHKS
jgi:hypothetical protein